MGFGFDDASPNEATMAVEAGAYINRIHYGYTIKSADQIKADYLDKHRDIGIRDFVTDNIEDVK